MLHMAHNKYSLLTYIISYTYLSGVHNVHLPRLHLSKRQYGLKHDQSGAGWSASLNYSQAQPKLRSGPHNLPTAKQC